MPRRDEDAGALSAYLRGIGKLPRLTVVEERELGERIQLDGDQAALTRLFNGRTVIAIAHRLSTVNAFDRIVVLDRGHILEQGPPAELLQREGAYSRMYVRQLTATRHP